MESRPENAPVIRRSEGINANDNFKKDKPLTVPARTRATLLLDQQYLTNAYPTLTVSGGKGAKISLTYSEAMYVNDREKGNRNEIEGKHIRGFTDVFYPDGQAGRTFGPLWFRCYRYVQMEIETADEGLTVDGWNAEFTGYPFRENGYFRSDDPELAKIWETGWRTARLCAGRNLLRLSVLRADAIHGRHAYSVPHFAVCQRRRPPDAPRDQRHCLVGDPGRHPAQPLSDESRSDHPVVFALLDQLPARLLDAPRRPGLRAQLPAGTQIGARLVRAENRPEHRDAGADALLEFSRLAETVAVDDLRTAHRGRTSQRPKRGLVHHDAATGLHARGRRGTARPFRRTGVGPTNTAESGTACAARR